MNARVGFCGNWRELEVIAYVPGEVAHHEEVDAILLVGALVN